MGYTTRFRLHIDSADTKILKEVVSYIKTQTSYYLEFDPGDMTAYLTAHWYDWEIDMKNVSTHFKDVLLVLNGVGEDSDDVWRAYFKDSKMQFCKARLVFDDYDKELLE